MVGTPKTMNFIVDSKLELPVIALCTEDRSIYITKYTWNWVAYWNSWITYYKSTINSGVFN